MLKRKAQTAISIYQAQGWTGIKNHVYRIRHRHDERQRQQKKQQSYQYWIKTYDTLTDRDRTAIRRQIEQCAHKPLISIVMPVYNVEERWLRRAIDTVLFQLYPNWELCIADDHSSKPHIRNILEAYAAADPRIRVVFRSANGHISAASNSALEIARGEFTAFLDHDDELSEHALYMVIETLNAYPETDMLYSDEDMMDADGRRYDPKFKPDWSPDFFYSLNLITHLSVYRTDILREIGAFRLGVEGSQDYDLALRVTEEISASRIRHIPHVLYHWRAIPGSVAYSGTEKAYAHERARTAIGCHLKRLGIQATVTEGVGNLHRVTYSLPAEPPLASLLVLAHGHPEILRRSVESILSQTTYLRFEVCVIIASWLASKEKQISAALPIDPRLRISRLAAGSVASAYNEAAAQTAGELLCFLDGTARIVTQDWLSEMAGHSLQSAVGAVGGMILYPNGTVKHAGFVLGIRNHVGHAHRHEPIEAMGDFMRLQVIQNVSAVSAACMTIRRSVFEDAKGFHTSLFPNFYGDVDLCLRLREKGLRIAWTPYARICHLTKVKTLSGFEIPSTLTEETTHLQARWKHLLAADPHYNPNLTIEREDFSLALPPRYPKTWVAERGS